METLLNRAFDALKTLPKNDQERIAWEIIHRVEDKTEWDRIISQPESQAWLAEQATKALKTYRKIKSKLSLNFVSVPSEGILREDSYWKSFDDLPLDIKKLAEENYQLWKENPQHPGLRFKKIHKDLPVYSFRVGMKNRTVGIETEDGRIAWFWVGSFEDFKSAMK